MDSVPNEMKSRVIRALNKIIWIQNDLFARHYLPKDGVAEAITPPFESSTDSGKTTGEVVMNGGGCPFSG